MSLFLAPTASNMAEWVRKAAAAVNDALRRLGTAESAIATPVFPSLASAPSSPVDGQTYFDTTLHKARTWDGSAWNNLW